MIRAVGLTTAFGWPVPTGRISIAEELLVRGLHPRDPRLKYAARTLRACRPKSRPKLLARFDHTPTAIPLPAPAYPVDCESFGEQSGLAAAMQTSATARQIATVDGGWSILSRALLLWLSRARHLTWCDIAILTFVLQEAGDTQINRIDAAAFYAVSAHAEWRSAAVKFLEPYRETWAADYVETWPEYRKIAAVARAEYEDVPAWLCRSAAT